MKHKALLIILITNFILVSCSSSVINQTSENSDSNSTYSQNTWSWKTTTISTSEDWVTVKIISVDPKCIWCGKCARIDSTHFQMNNETHKAEAIQTSWNESELERAMSCCHVWAISVS